MPSVDRWRRLVSLGALAIGIVLFAITLRSADLGSAFTLGRRLALAVSVSLLASAVTHLIRTWAWAWCFPRRGVVSFPRLLRVRIAGEAISYLTVSGVAGDPLKAVLLTDRVPGREAAVSVALERISFIVGTGLAVGVAAGFAMVAQPLTPGWTKVYRAFAIGAGVLAAAIALIAIRRDSYLLAAFRALDRAMGGHVASGKAGRLGAEIGHDLGDVLRSDGRRLVALSVSTVLVYACMVAEVWLILHAVGVPISIAGAIAAETFSRVAGFAAVAIPANLGALEAASVAAAAAVGLEAAGAPLAIVRRIRGLFWAGAGLAVYPRSGVRGPRGEPFGRGSSPIGPA